MTKSAIKQFDRLKQQGLFMTYYVGLVCVDCKTTPFPRGYCLNTKLCWTCEFKEGFR